MLYLHGIGHFHPEIIIDNTFLESLDIGTIRSWIEERTGILARHTVLPLDYIRTTRNRDPRQATEAALYSHAEMAHRAARIALDRAGLDPTAIGLVISGGSSPWMGSPAEACLVAERLGIQAAAFDVNSACSTFAVQMRTLLAMQPTALPDFILVVNPESLTCAVSYDDRGTAVLMGDCGSAAVVSPRIPACRRIDRACYESDPANWRKVDIPAAGYLTQDGSAVQAFAIRKTVAAIERLRPLAKSPRFVGHQANLLMLRSVAERAGIADADHWYNVDRCGNCGAAGAPSVLSEHWDEMVPGRDVLLAVVGAGLTWAGLLIETSYD